MSDSKVFKTIKIVARIASVGTSAILWYWTYKYIFKEVNDDNEYGIKSNEDYNDCYKIIRMKIPSYSKGAIIGKSGSTIKKIQEKTKTTIKFLNKNSKEDTNNNTKDTCDEWTVDATKDNTGDSFDILLIRGLTLRVMEAEKEVKSIIDSVPIYNIETMLVDNRFVGKIIGKKGENIRKLKDTYKIQIDFDKSNTEIQRVVTFRGITENISECKKEIIKMIDTEVLKEKRFTSAPNPRMGRDQGSSFSHSDIPSTSGPGEGTVKLPHSFMAYPGGLNEKVRIYISSVVDCTKFYAHIINDELASLDSLSDAMTEYFSKIPKNEAIIFKLDDIVAGYYEQAQSWQRVKIIGIQQDLFEIIYLDYGDGAMVKKEHLRHFETNSKFLDLPFQAVRLMTHGIQPCGENWNESEINEFEALTKVGCSYEICAILKKINNLSNLEVQLIDEQNGIDIASKLISDGKAKPLLS